MVLTNTPIRQVVPRTLHPVGLALGEKPNGTTRTSANDSPSDATQTVDLNAEEHDRSYLYGDDEKPARSAQKSGDCSRVCAVGWALLPLRRPILPWTSTPVMRHS